MQKFKKSKTKLTATALKNAIKNAKVNIKNEANQITATAINAITNSPNPSSTNTTSNQTPQKSWFRKLLDNIYSVF